jgi:hypothetical protein
MHTSASRNVTVSEAGRNPAATDANLKRRNPMRSVAALVLFSLGAFGQDEPPAEVHKALRARVTEFFGYHTTGEFRKAMAYVAEESQDEYFGALKTKYESFKIDSISYSDNFTKARVNLTVTEKKRLSPRFPEIMFTETPSTLWKLENGNWFYVIEHTSNWVLPFGPSDPQAIENARKGKVQDAGITQDRIDQLGTKILGQASVDKNEVVLNVAKAGSDQVVFKNAQPGWVKVALAPAKLPEGMTATLDKTDVEANGQALLKISYTPPAGNPVPEAVNLTILMEPFSRPFPVTVRFAK